jgi:hypothetical protein
MFRKAQWGKCRNITPDEIFFEQKVKNAVQHPTAHYGRLPLPPKVPTLHT